jgi:hypothetical protein
MRPQMTQFYRWRTLGSAFAAYSGGYRSVGLGCSVLFLALLVSGCQKNPAITRTNVRNAIGGSLQIAGTYFTPGGQVNFSALNAPGRSSPLALGFQATAPDGGFTFAPAYTWNTSSTLPGCATGSTDQVSVHV